MRARLRQEIEAHGWNPRLAAYTGELDGDDLDASVLLLAYHHFAPATSDRMRSTLAAIEAGLGAGHGLLRRYRRPPGQEEGAFGICSFWAVELLARGAGTLDEAQRVFARLLAFQNDLGLFAEEIDPATGGALGNFPQGFTHVGLISAALAIEERAARERHLPRPRLELEVALELA
jgi:GH15 family glucan-1,4-alpha-glucosidase